MESHAAQLLDQRGKIGDTQDDSIPAAWLLALAAGHPSRAGRSRTAEQEVKRSERDIGEGREFLVLERESEVLGVELGGATYIADLIPNAVEGLDQAVGRFRRARFFVHGSASVAI